MKYLVLWSALLLAGCVTEPRVPAPCIVYTQEVYYYVGQPPVEQVACQCESGAVIPDECGGGIAPTDSVYLSLAALANLEPHP